MDNPAPRPREPGASITVLTLAVAFIWIAGAIAAAFALIGAPRLAAASMTELFALGAAVLLPALMALFSGAAVRESIRARTEAKRLADAADRLLNPEQSADESARKLAMSVRSEISTLDSALEQTLARLQEVEGQIARQARAVDEMGGNAKAGANQLISGMEREREELLRISNELNNQAATIGGAISRHTKSISEAARQAEAEVRAADQALDHRLTSFGAAAALITDRTHSLSGAAQASADSALRLETALSNALDILAKATSLTDAARQSAEAATLAANSTAGAVRDTTSRAVEDAKRAADLIRHEAAGVEREAAVALERLRDAAEAARAAAIGAREAVEDDEQAPAPQQRARPRVRPQADEGGYDNSWRSQPDPLESPPPRARASEPAPRNERPAPSEWTWRDLLSSVDNNDRAPAARAAPDAMSRLQHQIADPRGAAALPMAETITRAGLALNDVFSPSALERIAQRSRSGTQARRRAVQDAAPEATRRMADFLAQDARANQEAMQFLRNEGARIAELMGRGRAAMNAEAT
ncbi:MAG TPA: hypothetical protein PLK37_15530, partial [Terricaulis sp.]|nr:hypothetical protein [Terricaulis sp.]